ncbi:glucokinase [Paenibacillus taihuensis]|uniref:Glucokinase n=1 Tax=Paenibacillus taihuensis TaxID=1156355 RepID=A0A3D9Q3G7_9BACL|nr:ROK family protein [Paenibacillus taihuensis]REE55454.1 glucokinase [Paenibacillus taihuensis]
MSQAAVIGIDLGGTNMKAGIVTKSGTILRYDTIPTRAQAGKDALLDQIVEVISMYRSYAQSSQIEISAIGIGTAGYVNREGVIGFATDNLPGWSGTRLREELELKCGMPIVVDNDVNAMAMGEVWLGAGRHWDDFLCITLGTGIGGCLIEKKMPYRGRTGYAGAYGHQIVQQLEGFPCTCGLSGCWEQYASVTALKRLIGEMTQEGMEPQTPETLFARARSGGEVELHIVERYAQYIAIGLANLIHAFNPTAIVIGGAVTQQGEFLFERIRSYVSRCTMNVYVESPKLPIVPAELGDLAGMFGAAYLALMEDQSI